jgi:hypothetical protein
MTRLSTTSVSGCPGGGAASLRGNVAVLKDTIKWTYCNFGYATMFSVFYPILH